MNLKQVEIFTDGSCFLNDNGRGGYGALLIYGDVTKEIYGGYYKTSNNRMELFAAIKGLETLKERCKVTIYSDSRYVTEAINRRWIYNWIKKDFKGIKNPDLWKRFLVQIKRHDVELVWVKGHSNVPGNDRADELATIGASLQDLVMDNRFT